MRRMVSQIPIGRTPGLLLSGTKRQAMKAVRLEGSTKEVQIRLVIATRAMQSSFDAPWNAVQMRCHPAASIPEGPAQPCTLREVERMRSPVIASKRIGCVSGERSLGGKRVAELACCAGGCLLLSRSRTGVPSISWSMLSTPEEHWSDTRRRAARTFP